ncbi:MAG: hypothetical protein ABGX16_13150 [Pirellulales bacterium]
MRFVLCLQILGAIKVQVRMGALVACMMIGCHSQTGSFTNPFTPPDRVPPPATQPLTPGTAQPYYPGGPIQPTAPVMGQPTVPPGTFAAPPVNGGSVYGNPSMGQPGMPVNPSVPASGWNSNSAPIQGSGTRSPAYGGQPTGAYTPIPLSSGNSAVSQTVVQAGFQPPQTPVQTILPVQNIALPVQNIAPVQTTALMQTVPQRPTFREIAASELPTAPQSVISQPAAPIWIADQFRSQGSVSVATGATFETQPITR